MLGLAYGSPIGLKLFFKFYKELPDENFCGQKRSRSYP